MMQMLLSIKEDSKCLREDNVALKQRMEKLETGATADTTETAATTSSAQPPPRKRRQQTPANSEDVNWQPIASDEVRGTVKQRLTTLADPSAQLLEPPFNMAEDQPEQQLEHQEPWMPQPNTRKQLPATGNHISGRHRTVDSTATHTVMWPQERVHDARGLRMKYEDLSWDKFVLGFLCCVNEAEPNLQPLLYMHLRELMEDAGMYGLEPVKAFHGVWLNHIEQGRATWHDEKTREKLRRQFVWNAPRQAPIATATHHGNAPANFSNNAAPSSSRGQGRRRQYAPVLAAGPDTKPCRTFNLGTCTKATSHPQADHVCSYCFKAQSRLCYHMERDCGNKIRAGAKN
jgi:hypothetical protein